MGILHSNNGQDGQLTPDFAREDPEGYSRQVMDLYGKFGSGQIKGERVMARLLDDGDIKGIEFDPDTWVGQEKGGVVNLGVAPLDPALRARIIFEDEKFAGDNEVLYRLSHELSHFVGSAIERVLPMHLGAIYGAIIDSRQHTGRGLSGLGSLEYYKAHSPKLQANEDITELINMYLIDPSYLKRFLSFLQSSGDRTLVKLGLMKLDAGVADFIFETIESGVKTWFSYR